MESPPGDPELIGVECDNSDAHLDSPPIASLLMTLGVAALAVGLVAAFFVLSRGSDPIVERQALPPPTTQIPAPHDELSTRQRETDSVDGTPFDANGVEVLPDHVRLQGHLALSTFVSFRNRGGTIWTLGPDGVAVRHEVPLWPGDWTHPIIFGEERLIFMSPPDALSMDDELKQAPARLIAARYVIPATTPDLVWAIDQPIDTVTEVLVASGEIRREYQLDQAITWVSAAVAGGFVVTANGDQRFWSPDRGFSDLPLPTPSQSGFRHARADKVVFISPGPVATVADLVTGERYDINFDVGEGLVTEACLSPDLRYLAIASSTGEARLLDVEASATIAEFSTARSFDAIGWTSEGQLVYIDQSSYLLALDVASGDSSVVARPRYTDDRPIVLTGAGASC